MEMLNRRDVYNGGRLQEAKNSNFVDRRTISVSRNSNYDAALTLSIIAQHATHNTVVRAAGNMFHTDG